MLSRELGYRHRFGSAVSVDLASFYNTYDDLRTQEPTLPAGIPIVLRNNMTATTSGIEATAEYEPSPKVRLHAGYTLLSEQFRLLPGSHDVSNGTAEHNDPRNQVWARAFINLAARGGDGRGLPLRRRAA